MSMQDDYRWRDEHRRSKDRGNFAKGTMWGLALSAILWTLLYLGYKALVTDSYPIPADYHTTQQGAR